MADTDDLLGQCPSCGVPMPLLELIDHCETGTCAKSKDEKEACPCCDQKFRKCNLQKHVLSCMLRDKKPPRKRSQTAAAASAASAAKKAQSAKGKGKRKRSSSTDAAAAAATSAAVARVLASSAAEAAAHAFATSSSKQMKVSAKASVSVKSSPVAAKSGIKRAHTEMTGSSSSSSNTPQHDRNPSAAKAAKLHRSSTHNSSSSSSKRSPYSHHSSSSSSSGIRARGENLAQRLESAAAASTSNSSGHTSGDDESGVDSGGDSEDLLSAGFDAAAAAADIESEGESESETDSSAAAHGKHRRDSKAQPAAMQRGKHSSSSSSSQRNSSSSSTSASKRKRSSSSAKAARSPAAAAARKRRSTASPPAAAAAAAAPAHSDSSDAESEPESEERVPVPAGCLSLEEFSEELNRSFEAGWGGREACEQSPEVRGLVCQKMKGGTRSCMYGSIMPRALHRIIQEAGVTAADVFLDIGSGIGQVVLQVAACTGAHSIGIELVQERHATALQLKELLTAQLQQQATATGTAAAAATAAEHVQHRTELLQSAFEEREDRVQQATVIYFNNAADYFSGTRESEKPEQAVSSNLEETLIQMLKRGRQGVRLITLQELKQVPNGWLTDCNRKVFQLLRRDLDQEATSWRSDLLSVFIYTISPVWSCGACTLIHEQYGEYENLCSCGTRKVIKRITRTV